jgi:hypothetical protein
MAVLNNFEIILGQLKNTMNLTTTNVQTFKPYDDNMTLSKKVQLTYRALLRSTRMNNQLLALVNSFYLGQLLDDETITPAQRTQQTSTITTHYYRTAVQVFHLFENLEVQRIFGTQSLTLTMIRRLKTNEYQALVMETTLSAGAEILSGE